jgi:hypothetical protein
MNRVRLEQRAVFFLLRGLGFSRILVGRFMFAVHIDTALARYGREARNVPHG